LARVFFEHCLLRELTPILDREMPEPTRLAFFIQEYVNRLGQLTGETGIVGLEFVIEQLLGLALKADYGDEMGRRKMQQLLRQCIPLPLSDSIIRLMIEVLRVLLPQESEFSDILLDSISDVHDSIEEDEPDEAEASFHSACSVASSETHADASNATLNGLDRDSTPAPSPLPRTTQLSFGDSSNLSRSELKSKEVLVNLKCLHIAQCMLENVQGNLCANSQLVTLLHSLIIPAVRSHDAPIRERGLHCLGLCCLLDGDLSDENLPLFMHCFENGHEELQIEALHIVCDILMSHGVSAIASLNGDGGSGYGAKKITKVFQQGLASEVDSVQAEACTAICKLVLAGLLKGGDILRVLLLCFYDIDLDPGSPVKQILSYFLPVYGLSRAENRVEMQAVVVPVLRKLILLYEDCDIQGLPTLTQICSQLAEWTDGRRSFSAKNGGSDDSKAHALLAISLLQRLAEAPREEKKLLCSMLNKLHVSPLTDPALLRSICDEGSDLKVVDPVARNALQKFLKAAADLLEDYETLLAETGTPAVVPVGDGAREDLNFNDGRRTGDTPRSGGSQASLDSIREQTTSKGDSTSTPGVGEEARGRDEEQLDEDSDSVSSDSDD
jgi:condensin complex subunit 3